MCLIGAAPRQDRSDCIVLRQVSKTFCRVVTTAITVIIITQFLILVLKVFVCAIRIDYIKLATFRVSLLNFWHFNLQFVDGCKVDRFEELVVLDLLDAEAFLAIGLDKTTYKTFGGS